MENKKIHISGHDQESHMNDAKALIKSDTGFAITICSSPLLEYWSPWLFSRQHFGHQ